MIQIIKTDVFDAWLRQLRDHRARAKIMARMARLGADNAGDVKPVGAGVSEMRINCGPGYRVYFMRRGPVVVVLLCGDDKASQQQDIAQAKRIAAQWKEKDDAC